MRRPAQARPTLVPAKGLELVAGKCKPCKDDRHDDCVTIYREVHAEDDVYPFFDDEPIADPGGWRCACLEYAEDRRLGIHGGYDT